MSYDISLYRTETKIKELNSDDENFFDNCENLVPFTEEQYRSLKARLEEYDYVFQEKNKYGLLFGHEEYGTALLTEEALFFTTSFNYDDIFDVGLIVSELTDTGEFAKYDPQNDGWEDI